MILEPWLPDALVERVLARLGISAPRPDADGLAALYGRARTRAGAAAPA